MEALKRFRAKRKLTQEQAALLLGVSQSFIALVEGGGRGISPETAIDWEERTNGALPRYLTRPDLWTKNTHKRAS